MDRIEHRIRMLQQVIVLAKREGIDTSIYEDELINLVKIKNRHIDLPNCKY